MAAILILCVVLLSASVPVHAETSAETPHEEKSYRSHPMIFDWTIGAAALGAIGGFVTGACHDDGFHSEFVVGHAFLGLLVGFFAGASWGGEDAGPDWHPPTPVAELKELRLRSHRGDPVEVWTDDGAVALGKLGRIRKTEIELKTEEGTRSIPDASILRIATRRDPSWDGMVWGAVYGGASADIWYRTTTRRPGSSASEAGMILAGAGILGITCLAGDMFHNGRSVVLDRAIPTSHSFGVHPRITSHGAGVAVSLRF
jgi:hypothetical protein